MLTWIHFIAAIFAVILGLINLTSKKGTFQHRILGWSWLLLMTSVTVPSFWIRDLNDGNFSWIHLLTVWTLISMGIALCFIFPESKMNDLEDCTKYALEFVLSRVRVHCL